MAPPDPSNDRLGSLMCAAQRGDATAYRELLREITPRVRRVIARQRGFSRAEDVEDLVQEVLLSLHAVRATYDPARPFMPWLLAIVRNRLADGGRRYWRTAAHEVQIDDADVTFAQAATNFGEDSSDDLAALDHALRALPSGQRQAIELVKLQELSLKEAAATSGATIGALKVAVHRGMVALRKALKGGPQRT
jgi:RNA polymerase sigma factor (sigma-70 family)